MLTTHHNPRVSQMAGMPFGPMLEALLGPALTAALGGLMMAVGTFAASYATTLSSFVGLYSVVFGLGVGIAYQMPFIVGVRAAVVKAHAHAHACCRPHTHAHAQTGSPAQTRTRSSRGACRTIYHTINHAATNAHERAVCVGGE